MFRTRKNQTHATAQSWSSICFAGLCGLQLMSNVVYIVYVSYASNYYRFRDIAAYWSKIAIPLYLAPPLDRWSCQIYATTLGDEKLEWWAYQTVKECRWCVEPFWYKSRVWLTDEWTDGIAVAYTRYSMLSRVKMAHLNFLVSCLLTTVALFVIWSHSHH